MKTIAALYLRVIGASLAAKLGDARGIFMPNHGAVTVGPNIATAGMYAVLLERACRTALSAIAAGGPRVWSDEAETQFKRGQVWNPAQLEAGWHYWVRQSRKGLT